MRIVYITAGAGGTICGNCLHDNTLAAALIELGHDVVLQPVYTPIRTDETDVSQRDVLLGGVNLYLEQKSAFYRRLPRFLTRPLDRPDVLRWASRFAVKTLPEDLGALTAATLEGEDGPLRAAVRELTSALRKLNPQIVHLTNSMLAGLAGPIRRELGVPVVCSLQGEDYFLEHLPEPWRTQAFERLAGEARHTSLFLAPCRDQARSMGPRLGLDPDEIPVVMPGIEVKGFSEREPRKPERFVVGYMARIAPEKGADLLAEAVAAMGSANPASHLELRLGGWLSPEHREFLARVERIISAQRAIRLSVRQDVSREEKTELLRDLDVLSVPTLYGASKGLYVMEAWACGVPVVQPRIGIFPELIERAEGGGLLVEPGGADALRLALERLKADPEETRRLGAGGKRAVLETFNAGRMARETIEIYRQLV